MYVRRQSKLSKFSSKKWIPHKYQLRAIAKGITHKYLAYFLDPGLGKTSIILQLFKILKANDHVKAILVVAPLRQCYLVWPKEVSKWKNFSNISIKVLHDEWKVPKNISIKQKHDIYVINPEGLPWLLKQLKGKRKVNWRSEERRVGKECKSRWSPYHYKKKEKDQGEKSRRKEEMRETQGLK